jgi:hypothetical protein
MSGLSVDNGAAFLRNGCCGGMGARRTGLTLAPAGAGNVSQGQTPNSMATFVWPVAYHGARPLATMDMAWHECQARATHAPRAAGWRSTSSPCRSRGHARGSP